MSDLDEKEPEMKELINKMSRYNKNTKALMELIGRVSEKLDKVLDWNGKEKNVDDEKEKMDKIFEKKQLGRPRGDHKTKRLQYFEMVKNKKIKEPKPQTLEYYKINYDKSSDTYTLLDIED